MTSSWARPFLVHLDSTDDEGGTRDEGLVHRNVRVTSVRPEQPRSPWMSHPSCLSGCQTALFDAASIAQAFQRSPSHFKPPSFGLCPYEPKQA